MHIVKTKLHNKIEYDFLADSLMLHIKREIATKLSTNSIINDFRDIK
jgi:predicted lipoprotein